MWSQSLLSAALLLVLPSPELASPHLYPASTYPLGSLHYQPLNPVYYNGFYSPWNTFQPGVQAATAASAPTWQAASAPVWQAASAPALQAARKTPPVPTCGTGWTPYNSKVPDKIAGCYKYFGEDQKKGWEAARKQCRKEGFKEGVEADLAYFEANEDYTKAIGLISEDETTWLRGKMENAYVEVMKGDKSGREKLELPSGITWAGGSKPVVDINTDRKLYIKKSSNIQTFGVEKGSHEKGFLCEYSVLVEKKACPDGWDLDQTTDGNYRRCLKLLTDANGPIRKTWKEAYDKCKEENSAATLVKLAPIVTEKLKGIEYAKKQGNVGIWVNEYSSIDAPSKITLINEDGTVTTTVNLGLNWAVGYGNYGTGTQRVFLNSEAKLATNDGTGKANVVCQVDSEFVWSKPLVRSLL